jgi:hypothetical protein
MVPIFMDVRSMSTLQSPSGHMIVDEHEGVTMTPPHNQMSTGNSLSLIHKGKCFMVDFIQHQEIQLTHQYIKENIKHLYFIS